MRLRAQTKRQLVWKVYFRILLLLLLSLLIIGWYAAQSYRSFFLEHVRQDLYERTLLLEDRFLEHLSRVSNNPAAQIDPLCKELGKRGNYRITCILPDGDVVGDSAEDIEEMENHADRPEIKRAIEKGQVSSKIRYSETLETMLMYTAVPLKEGGRLYGVLRSAMSMERLQEKLGALLWRIAFAGIFIAFVAALAAYRISRMVRVPLELLKDRAVHMSRGDLSVRSPAFSTRELDDLAEAMNSMAGQLEERIATISGQYHKEELILSNLMDGVITLDSRGRVVTINPSAAGFLSLNSEKVPGLRWEEAIRDPKIREFVRSCFDEKRENAETVIGDEKKGTFLRLRFGVLTGVDEENELGSLILLQDVTQAKRMEYMRRDFVAGVSHELRTPVTAIQGFAETLLDEEETLDTNTRSFLEIIKRHSSRLIKIVDDLLSLSRIEYQSERGEISRDMEFIGEWLQEAVEKSRPQAEEKGIRLEFLKEDGLSAYINGELISQAVSNLLDNAIKYSPEGTMVRLETRALDASYNLIEVADNGPGIGEEHQQRIFERFYRVDKARSRELGGTGLGLSIVKHIVHAHGGTIEVTSRLGEGSVFRIYVPRY